MKKKKTYLLPATSVESISRTLWSLGTVCVCVCVCMGVVILNSQIIAMYFCVGGGLSYWLLGTHT